MVYSATYNQPSFYKPLGSESGKTIFNEDVESFLESSKNVASAILHPKATQATTSSYTPSYQPKTNVIVVNPAPVYPIVMPVHHYNTYNTYNSYNHGFHPVHVNNKEKDNEPGGFVRVLAGVAAAIIGGIGLYFLGKHVANKEETEKELSSTKEFKAKLSVYKQECPNNDHLVKMEKIVKAKERIFTVKNSVSFWNIALLVGAVASAALLLVGAVFASAPFMAIGFLGAVAVGGFFLFKLGFGSKDEEKEADAKIIQNTVDELWKAKKPILPPMQQPASDAVAPVVMNVATATATAAQPVFFQQPVNEAKQPNGLQPNTIAVTFQIDPVEETVVEKVAQKAEMPASATTATVEKGEEKTEAKPKIPTPPPMPKAPLKKGVVDALHPLRHEDKKNIGPHILKGAGAAV